jgi:uncharacterized protein with PhoU and TrkA domain
VLVLSIIRQGLTIPNPRGSREILEGDTLICFGKHLTLSTLVPAKKPKKVKKKRDKRPEAEPRVARSD